MYVYIESVIIDNFLIDCLLLLLATRFARCPVSVIGIVLGATFGTGFALFSPFLHVYGAWLWLIKFAVANIMVLISLPSLYRYFLRLITFVCLTFLFGGAMIALFYFLDMNVHDVHHLSYYSSLPIGGILAVAVSLFILLYIEIHRLYKIRQINSYLVDVVISIRNTPIKLRGYLDTGNGLIDRFGQPVVIIHESDLRYWFTPAERVDLLLHRFHNVLVTHPHIIHLNTIQSHQSILVFHADYLLLDNRKLPVSVGVQPNRTFQKTFDVLLNLKLLEVA